MTTTRLHDDTFASSTAGLRESGPSAVVELRDGDTYDLHIAPVANQIGDTHVRMLAFNGSVPGPTLRVAQGSEISVRVRNDGDHDLVPEVRPYTVIDPIFGWSRRCGAANRVVEIVSFADAPVYWAALDDDPE